MKNSINKNLLSLMVAVLLPLSSFGVEYVRGDVNRNRTVDISDVTYLIGKVLSSGGAYIPICDVNFDRATDIADVTALIHYVLLGVWTSPDYSGPPIPDNAEFYTVNGVSFAMVPVEGGTFMMGYGNTEYSYPGSHASHQVTLSSFKIGVTEVTQELWMAVMGTNPSPDQSNVSLLPVCCVSWHDCKNFIDRLNELTGLNFNFPTDAQWEFAARGGNFSQGYLYAGSDDIDEVAWWADENATSLTWHPAFVGLKKSNELGLYDMSGNVSEWCYDDDWVVNNPDVEPMVDPVYERASVPNESLRRRIMRGGSRYDEDAFGWEFCTVYSRDRVRVYDNHTLFGLRLAIWPQ